MGFLDNLKIDVWYMLVLYVGVIGLFIILLTPVQNPNKEGLILLFIGAILTGLGEWKRVRHLLSFKPPNAYTGPAATIKTRIQVADPIGILLEVVGIILIGMGLWRIIF